MVVIALPQPIKRYIETADCSVKMTDALGQQCKCRFLFNIIIAALGYPVARRAQRPSANQ